MEYGVESDNEMEYGVESDNEMEYGVESDNEIEYGVESDNEMEYGIGSESDKEVKMTPVPRTSVIAPTVSDASQPRPSPQASEVQTSTRDGHASSTPQIPHPRVSPQPISLLRAFHKRTSGPSILRHQNVRGTPCPKGAVATWKDVRPTLPSAVHHSPCLRLCRAEFNLPAPRRFLGSQARSV